MERKLGILLCNLILLLPWKTGQTQDWQIFGYEKLPGAEYMLDLDFLTSDMGWVVGESGKIYKTVDGGQTWIEQSLSADIEINQVQFLDEQYGYINTGAGIHRTADGGQNWEIVNSTFVDFSRFAFNDADRGWLIDKQGIYQTADGGRTWEFRTTAAAYQRFVSIATTEPDHCLVGASIGWIQVTKDGGQTWSIYQPLPGANSVNSIDFITEQKGYIKGYAKTRITTDGGETVLAQDLRTPSGFIDMINEQEGWIYNAVSRLYHTIDGGLNWDVQYESLFLDFTRGQFFENRTGWLIGENESIHKTTDGGEHWEMSRIKAPSFNAVEYINPENSWAVGEEGVIYFKRITSPVWKRIESGLSQDFTDVAFINPSSGWIVGEEGVILATTDAGQSWTEQMLPGEPTNLHAIEFFNDQGGIIVGQTGVIIRTIDQGVNWTATEPLTTATLNDITYAGNEIIWIVGDTGTVLMSHDQGLTWQPENWPTAEHLKAVFFTSAEQGFIASASGKVYRTEDGGDNWNEVLFEEGRIFNAISFSSSGRGVVVGNEGIIYRTTDAGNTWTRDNNQIKEDLNAVVFYDDISAWAVGKDGTIIKHIGDITNVEDPILSQSIVLFPNPARTVISIKSSDLQIIDQLHIYDSAGRLVETKKAINKNVVTFNLKSYLPGIYFLQIGMGEEVLLKKFINE